MKIRIGANVNADQTKAYAANTCNYGADIGKYAEVVRSTPEQPETITGQTGYLGKSKDWHTVCRVRLLIMHEQ